MIHILIIDDEDPIRNLLARMVELEGYQASKAADCRSALKMLNTQRFEGVTSKSVWIRHRSSLV